MLRAMWSVTHLNFNCKFKYDIETIAFWHVPAADGVIASPPLNASHVGCFH
jgi:hypothetical protein